MTNILDIWRNGPRDNFKRYCNLMTMYLGLNGKFEIEEARDTLKLFSERVDVLIFEPVIFLWSCGSHGLRRQPD